MHIQKIIGILLGIFLLLQGCSATTPVKREVTNENMFQSSVAPMAEIPVNPELAFLGKSRNSRHPFQSNNHINIPMVYETYLFGKVEKQVHLNKAVLVTMVRSMDRSLPQELFPKDRYYIEKGEKALAGEKFQNAVFLVSEETDLSHFESYLADTIDDKGYFLPMKYLVSSYGRVVDPKKNIAFFVTFLESYGNYDADAKKDELLREVSKRFSEATGDMKIKP